MSQIKDITLAPSGADKIAWVASYMPILNHIKKEFEQTLPFKGMKIAMSIHLEAKTAYLAKVLRAGGAEVFVTGCNPLSTQDDVAAALAAEGFEVFARRGVSDEEYTEHLKNMGANIEYDERRALLQIFGVSELHGATVKAPDLRAGAALILAGLAATGTTTVTNVELVERGYDHIIEKLLSLGADIKKERF